MILVTAGCPCDMLLTLGGLLRSIWRLVVALACHPQKALDKQSICERVESRAM